MGLFFYNIFLFLFRITVPVVALFNPKAKKWVDGRKNILERMEAAIDPDDKVIWVHCASLGEFEQGRTVIELLRKEAADYKILLTFFSPSGYEVRKDYPGADWIFYLPFDGARTAKRFLEITHPSLVIFIKYEFWFYYLKKLKYRKIPLLLVSALFLRKMSFFKWYGGLSRKMVTRFDHVFVQDNASLELLKEYNLAGNASISGDTRFDRVTDIAEAAAELPLIRQFLGDARAIVAGSTWPNDESALAAAWEKLSANNINLIIAPHEIDSRHIENIEEKFPGAVRYSDLNKGQKVLALDAQPRVLIIDNIGLLSRLYRYAHVCYIGGGFTKGIHNTLEAAVYGRPVLFGPVFEKFKEAKDLIQQKGAISVDDEAQLIAVLTRLFNDEQLHHEMCKASRNYVYAGRGATQKVWKFIQEKRLLTS